MEFELENDSMPLAVGLVLKLVAGLRSSATPLSFTIYSVLPSALMLRAVGYQPVGIRPSSFGAAGVVTSSTATEFSPASATYSRALSGETTSAFGYEPWTRWPFVVWGLIGSGDRLKSASLRLLATNIIPKASEFDLATYSTS